MRQNLLVALAGAVADLGPCTASAQTWPSRPVTMMVPFPAGGTADLMARECAQALSEELGQQFIVENQAGARRQLAAAAVAKAAPDGNTLLFASQSQAALNKFMFKNAPTIRSRGLVPVVAGDQVSAVGHRRAGRAGEEVPGDGGPSQGQSGKLRSAMPASARWGTSPTSCCSRRPGSS